MEIDPYPEWRPTIARLAESGGIVMLLGGADAGKTTFCTLLSNTAVTAGKRIAVVDADVGQSEIGPPGCVGLGVPQGPVRALSEAEQAGLAFVGATSPRGHLLEHIVAVRGMADRASQQQPNLVIVDTTGFIQGAEAVRLKRAKIDLLEPDHVIVLQRWQECEPILAAYRFSTRPLIEWLPVPEVIAVKSPVYRAQRRAARFASYFSKAAIHTYAMDQIALSGTWLGAGKPVAPHLLTFMGNSLRLRVYHAEEAGRHLGIVTGGPPTREADLATVQEQFRAQAITVTPAAKLRHLLVGLGDVNGKVMGVGLIEAIHFGRREIGILSPLRAPGAVKRIQFGILRVKADGAEVGTNRPGEV